jgi:signal transduction histidine kinase
LNILVLLICFFLTYRTSIASQLRIATLAAIAVIVGNILFLRPTAETMYIISTFVILIFCVFTLGRMVLTDSIAVSGILLATFSGYELFYQQVPFTVFLRDVMPVMFSAVSGYMAGRTIEYHYRKDFIITKEWLALNNTLDLANTIKTEFLSIAAHDLTNPLLGIVGLSKSMLRDESLAEETRRRLELINRSSTKMRNIIGHLLDVASVERGIPHMQVSQVNFSELITEVIQFHIPFAEKKAQSVETLIEPEVSISGDPEKLKSIVDNLISNAIKYTPAEKPITVSLRKNCELVYFSVMDGGPGFTSADLKKIFTPWQKLTARPTGGESSIGLGLSIVKNFVELHRGSVKAVNNPSGIGASLQVELPIALS